ncbi:Uncharacterised protein [Campylobacter geochelonis]|nr:Uncharacterised protein [Campylobacter geochelonis]
MKNFKSEISNLEKEFKNTTKEVDEVGDVVKADEINQNTKADITKQSTSDEIAQVATKPTFKSKILQNHLNNDGTLKVKSDEINGDGFVMKKDGKMIFTDKVKFELGEYLKNNIDINENPITASLNYLFTHHKLDGMFKSRREVKQAIEDVLDGIPNIIRKQSDGTYYFAKAMKIEPTNKKSFMKDMVIEPKSDENYIKHVNQKAFNKEMRETIGGEGVHSSRFPQGAKTLGNNPELNKISYSPIANDIIPQKTKSDEINGDGFVMKVDNSKPMSDYNVKFDVSPNIRDLSKLTTDEISADLEYLANKHPEMFSKPSDVFRLIKEIKENPTFFYNNNRLDYALIVKRLEKVSKEKDAGIIQTFTQQGNKLDNQGLGYQTDDIIPQKTKFDEITSSILSSPQTGRDMFLVGKDNLNADLLKWSIDNNRKIAVDKLDVAQAKELGFKYPDDVRRTINPDEIKHTLKNHGKESEVLRGQDVITFEDIAKYRDLVENPDKIRIGKTKQNNTAIISAKQINGHYIIVEEVQKGNNELAFKTMRKMKGNVNDSKLFQSVADTKTSESLAFEGYKPTAQRVLHPDSEIIPQTISKNNKRTPAGMIPKSLKHNEVKILERLRSGYKDIQSSSPLIKSNISHIRSKIQTEFNINPIKEFGTNYAEFYHDGISAIKKLLNEKQGQVAGAFSKENLGDIDLVWGDDKFGLEHILKRRIADYIKSGLSKQEATQKAIDFINKLPQMIDNGELSIKKNDAIKILTEDGKIILKSNFYGKPTKNKWLVTAYENIEKGSSISTEPFTKGETLPLNSDNDIIPQKIKFDKTPSTNDIKIEKIDDFGEKIGGARKDLGIKHSIKKLTSEDKTNLLKDELIKPQELFEYDEYKSLFNQPIEPLSYKTTDGTKSVPQNIYLTVKNGKIKPIIGISKNNLILEPSTKKVYDLKSGLFTDGAFVDWLDNNKMIDYMSDDRTVKNFQKRLNKAKKNANTNHFILNDENGILKSLKDEIIPQAKFDNKEFKSPLLNKLLNDKKKLKGE